MLSIILVEPEGEVNIGSVARAMMNMGESRLILVNPKCDPLSKQAMDFSVHASEILTSARVVSDLSEALNGMDLSVSVSRRTGHYRKRDLWSNEIGEFLSGRQNQNIGIVFGREQSGLTAEEIRMTDAVCSILSHSEFPSLNLSHAVMVILYEIYSFENPVSVPLAEPKRFESMHAQIMGTLKNLGFFKRVPENRLSSYLRKLLTRMKPDNQDAHAIENLFKRIEGSVKRLQKD